MKITKHKIPTHDPQTGELNPYYKQLTDKNNPMNEKWYNSIDTSKALDYLMDDNTKLRHLIMKNENERTEQEAQARIKINRLGTEVNELKFCVYALMFLITMVLLVMAFF